MARDVAVVIGSLRKDSFTRKIARAAMELAPNLNERVVEIGDLPLYNQDLDTDAPPPQWTRFRDEMRGAEAVLFATPEYNRSVPGALKNAIDVGSRPYGKSVFAGKPAAVISVTPGALGAFGANHHLRQSLVFLDMPTMPQPEIYIAGVAKLLDEQGKLNNDGAKDLLRKFAQSFEAWIDHNAAH